MDNDNKFIKEQAEDPKTSSSNGEDDDEKSSGESSVQQGEQVVNEEDQNQALNKEQANEEYINDINNNTKEANTNPIGLTGLMEMPEDEEEDDDEEDDDDDPLKEIEIGDDPDETKKKIPVMI